MDFANLSGLFISILYYALVGITAFFGIFGAYILIRYGQSLTLSFLGSVVFSIFFIVLLSSSYNILQSIL